MRTFFLFSLLVTLFTACAMPDDETFCTTPMTNNPNIIPQRDAGCLPGMGGQ